MFQKDQIALWFEDSLDLPERVGRVRNGTERPGHHRCINTCIRKRQQRGSRLNKKLYFDPARRQSCACHALKFNRGVNPYIPSFLVLHWLLLAGVAVGRIATRGGSRRDGGVAMAIFASYIIGQFMQLFY